MCIFIIFQFLSSTNFEAVLDLVGCKRTKDELFLVCVFQSTVCSTECFGATGMESSRTFTSSAGVPHASSNSQI